jgi:hypothetical protein
LDISLFERLVNHTDVPVACLETQRRMLPEISRCVTNVPSPKPTSKQDASAVSTLVGTVAPACRLVRPIYPTLKDHPSVATYPPVKGMVHSLFFMDHDHPEQGHNERSSKSNQWEARFSVLLARYLLQQGYSPSENQTLWWYAALQRHWFKQS